MTLYFVLDGHVCWHSKRRLPSIVCRPRKTNFRFPLLFAANKRKFSVTISVCSKRKMSFSVSSIFHIYIYTEYRFPYIYPWSSVSIYILYIYIRKMELTENGNLFAVNGKRKRKTLCIIYRQIRKHRHVTLTSSPLS
jgi:hypothetical protein